MPEKTTKKPKAGSRALATEVKDALAWLEKKSSRRDRENFARFGIAASKGLGVSVANIRVLAKKLGKDHELAAALWETGCYEARMLSCFVDEPEQVTPAQMESWCRDFDNWAICDTACFHLFDRTPHAWKKLRQWSTRRPEFEKRAAFALLASLAGHDKKAGDAPFAESLALIERTATDERNFVKKAVSWALRSVGQRSPALHASSLALSKRLAASNDATARWVGKDALRDLTRPVVARRLERRKAKA